MFPDMEGTENIRENWSNYLLYYTIKVIEAYMDVKFECMIITAYRSGRRVNDVQNTKVFVPCGN